ncbi:hypothetical protein WME76_34295 [Sorangium sp. So ce119]|uniref:hypothetical protein n=1 Tax=Sorangium sp. So ce119 TaxID=3133279 RepID=UPI003F5E626C
MVFPSSTMRFLAKHGAFFGLFAALQLPALQPFAKFAPAPGIAVPAFLLAAAIGLWLLLDPPERLRRWLDTAWPSVSLVGLLALVAVFIYPMADGLKQRGAGSDADDAMILAGRALAELHNPYASTTYLGNPFSPGPGWVALWAPLSALGAYALISALALAATVLALRFTQHGWSQINTFVLALFSCVLLWELAAIGNDLPAWGLLVLCAALVLEQPRVSKGLLVALTALLGCLATARIAFSHVPLLIGLSLLPVKPRRALVVAVGGTAIALLLHAVFWGMNPRWYPPLHLMGQARWLLSGPSLFIALGFLGAVAAWMLRRWRAWPPPLHLAWGLGAPMLVLAAADLLQRGSLPRWKGATYLVTSLPVVAYALLGRIRRDHPRAATAGATPAGQIPSPTGRDAPRAAPADRG